MSPRKDSLGFALGPGGATTSEEVINGRLADFLAERLPAGVAADPEQRVHNRKVDIVVEKSGAHKIYLEAKLTTLAKAKEHAQQHFALLPSAKRPTHVGAICYSAAFHKPRAAENGEPLEFALLDRDSGEWSPARELTAAELAAILAEPVKLRDSENEIGNAIAAVKNALKEFTAKMSGREAQFAEALKIELPPPVKDDPKKHRAYVAARDEAMHIAGLVVVNAMMFSSALNRRTLAAKNGESIAPYDGVAPERLKRHWARVEDGINYVSILAPARRLIDAGACDEETLSILKQAADRIRPLAERGVDILGRVFHTVLAQAKTYAAFFTGIPGATLMSEIALDPDRWENVNWRDPESIGELRVCDPACGSGTLIALAAWKLRRNFRFRVDENRAAKLENLHRLLVEKVIYAADIIPAAAHLAATSVALVSPQITFDHSNIFCVPMGILKGGLVGLGSLPHLAGKEFLENFAIDNLGVQVEGEKAREFPELDACLMNPPFVDLKSKGDRKFSFAGMDAPHVRNAFRKMAKEKKFSSGFGQGAAFMTLAARRIKPGGRLAMILPSALAVGGSATWRGCRKVIADDFDVEAVVASMDPVRPAFSDSTNKSEMMLVARKRTPGDARVDDALFAVLHANRCAPDALGGSRADALEIASAINDAIENKTPQGAFLGGAFARRKWRGKPAWTGINFADFSLTAEISAFGENGSFAGVRIPTVALGKAVGHFGNYNLAERDLKKHRLGVFAKPPGFGYYCPSRLKKDKGIANKNVFTLAEDPHYHLRAEAGENSWTRNFENAAGRIVVNHSFRFNSSRRLVAMTSAPVQSSSYHPVVLKKETDEKRKAATLWLNSTLILAHIALGCNPTCGSKVKFNQAALSRVPILDFDRLDAEAANRLAEGFDRFVLDGEVLNRFPAMEHDAARARLDDAVADALGIDRAALADLRRRLAKEPIISNKPYPAPA